MHRIVLSAGHHPAAPGAKFLAATPPFIEHDEASTWVLVLAERLVELGAEPILLPQASLEELSKTVTWINSLSPRAEAALEIHFNDAVAGGQQVGRGHEVLYSPGSERGRALAEAVNAAMRPFFPPDRGAEEGWLRRDRPGHVDYPGDHDGDEAVAYFLKATNCPAVIVEPDFVVNHARIREHRDAACAAIARALVELET